MAQTKRRRKRKRRGTQGGSIDQRRRARPRSREEAKAQARRRAETRKQGRTPSWTGAFWRGLLGAAIFFAMTRFVFGETTGRALGLSAVMLALYIPLSYYIDRFFYARRLKKEREERAQRH